MLARMRVMTELNVMTEVPYGHDIRLTHRKNLILMNCNPPSLPSLYMGTHSLSPSWRARHRGGPPCCFGRCRP